MSKLYIKGKREPIDISEENAEYINKLFLDQSQPYDLPIVIGGVWSGKKQDIKFISFEKEKTYEPEVEAMDPHRAILFGEELEPFKAEGEKIKEGWGFLYKMLWMQKQEAINVHIIDLPHQGTKTYRIGVVDPVKFQELSKKLESYEKWHSKRDYAEQMKNKQLEEMANQIS